MILLITNKEDITVDFIVQELKKRNCCYYRLNTEDIPEFIDVDFCIERNHFHLIDKKKGISINLLDVSSVYFRRPKISTLQYIPNLSNQEKIYLRFELSFCLEAIYKILKNAFWINDVYHIREAENKVYQLQIAKQLELNVPSSLISNRNDSIKEFLADDTCNYIIKPIKSGNVSPQTGSQVIFTSRINRDAFCDNERVAAFPVYLQREINKKYDVRCIIVGKQIFAAQIDSQHCESSVVDWRRADQYLPHKRIDLPPAICKKMILLTKRLGLTYSAIDLIQDLDGNYVFLECNPNGQWAWIEKRLGYPISACIVDALLRRNK